MNDNKIMSGVKLSAIFKEDIKQEILKLKEAEIHPRLSVIIVGDDHASAAYINGKVKDCIECGLISDNISFLDTVSQEQLIVEIEKLNNDSTVHGILVQLPLPKHIDEYEVVNAILPQKDVDGVTTLNMGKLYLGIDCLVPCTPQACVDILEENGVEISGKNIIIVGRSNIVGKPLGALLLQKNATVTICHSRTVDLSTKTKQADIIVMAIGKAGFLKADMIKKDAVIVDVGINFNDKGKMCGDVDFDDCIEKASKITPVPGGVGPVTRTNLLKNTIKAAKLLSN